MGEPAFKNRKEMSEDLEASGFDEKQARSILRVVGGVVKELNLPTRAEWEQFEKRAQERHEQYEKRAQERHEHNQKEHQHTRELLQRSEKHNLHLHEQARQSNQQQFQQIDQRFQKLEDTTQRIFLWMRWGLVSIVVPLLVMLITSVLRGG